MVAIESWQSDGCHKWRCVMGFPDRIERSISVAHPPAKVWEAITTAEGLGTWFGHTWGISGLPADDPRRTYVEFTLEPVAEGTRLTVVESGFAQLPDDLYSGAYGGNVEGWQSELGELVEYLDARA